MNVHGLTAGDPPPASATPKSAPKRKADSPYETPTPGKVEAGRRMAHAREIAGLSQAEAAQLLGYSQAVQLSLMESGHRPVPLEKVVAVAKLYGTTTDFILGLVDDPDRDPAAALLRGVQAQVAADLQGLLRTISRESIVSLGCVTDTAAADRLACLAAEVLAALALVVARNSEFEDLRGGATLMAKAELAGKAVKAYTEDAARTKRAMRVRANWASNNEAYSDTAREPAVSDGANAAKAASVVP